ncbi:hypothetical protein [Herbidospora yilanensis]|uniref:hypothetical protein n=1 Tax=Herbidospora yilanensis TaxID=354426 RepID=UPI0012F7FB0F|nr:hypothetical protein [Herbidospora yilanensis]
MARQVGGIVGCDAPVCALLADQEVEPSRLLPFRGQEEVLNADVVVLTTTAQAGTLDRKAAEAAGWGPVENQVARVRPQRRHAEPVEVVIPAIGLRSRLERLTLDSPTGPGVFAELGALKPGHRILVRLKDRRTLTFRVEEVRTHEKKDFPTRDVYGASPRRPAPPHHLRGHVRHRRGPLRRQRHRLRRAGTSEPPGPDRGRGRRCPGRPRRSSRSACGFRPAAGRPAAEVGEPA